VIATAVRDTDTSRDFALPRSHRDPSFPISVTSDRANWRYIDRITANISNPDSSEHPGARRTVFILSQKAGLRVRPEKFTLLCKSFGASIEWMPDEGTPSRFG
jgi:hypothetical protein